MTNYAVRHIYGNGSLSGLNTIHLCALGRPDEGGKRMFFSSNYDGSLESYMNDFIDKAAWGSMRSSATATASPNVLFVLRRHQGREGVQAIPAHAAGAVARLVSAYPDLSTKNIANNAAIREGCSGRWDATRRTPGCAARLWQPTADIGLGRRGCSTASDGTGYVYAGSRGHSGHHRARLRQLEARVSCCSASVTLGREAVAGRARIRNGMRPGRRVGNLREYRLLPRGPGQARYWTSRWRCSLASFGRG